MNDKIDAIEAFLISKHIGIYDFLVLPHYVDASNTFNVNVFAV